MQNAGKTVSAIVPCHNAGRWIVSALQSICRQTYPVAEIIVIDDDSTDDSIEKVANSGIDVRLLRVCAHNAAIARNAGIEAARGDFIALLDADDIWYPEHIARAVQFLEKGGDVAYMSNHDWIGFEDEIIPMPEGAQCKLSEPHAGLDTEDFFRLQNEAFHFGHSSVVYDAARVRDVGMFDGAQKYRHDVDLWLRVIQERTWTYDTAKGMGYREQTPQSISRNELECDYFYLRALTKNLGVRAAPEQYGYLRLQSRRAMGIAFTADSPEHYRRIKDLAWPQLTWKYRLFYRVAELVPQLSVALLSLKRRLALR